MRGTRREKPTRDAVLKQQALSYTQELPQDLLERAKNMRPPRDRITCLLIGNHSAGKSSFTNWSCTPCPSLHI